MVVARSGVTIAATCCGTITVVRPRFVSVQARTANPTTQGVSLRGVGASGASRALVLLDGVPLNDPFGGWVYWTRVPLMNATKMEVVDGSTSSLYGNYALGGVVSIDSRTPQKRTLIFQPQFGIFSSKVPGQYDHLYTPKVDFYVSDVYGKLGVSLEGSVMNSNGYPVIAPDDRGATRGGIRT